MGEVGELPEEQACADRRVAQATTTNNQGRRFMIDSFRSRCRDAGIVIVMEGLCTSMRGTNIKSDNSADCEVDSATPVILSVVASRRIHFAKDQDRSLRQASVLRSRAVRVAIASRLKQRFFER